MGNRKLLQRSLWAGPTRMAEESATIEIRRHPQGPPCSLAKEPPRVHWPDCRAKYQIRHFMYVNPRKRGGTQILRDLVRKRFTK